MNPNLRYELQKVISDCFAEAHHADMMVEHYRRIDPRQQFRLGEWTGRKDTYNEMARELTKLLRDET